MNILIYEYNYFGTDDVKEALVAMGHNCKIISTPAVHDRVNPDFDRAFDLEMQMANYDCVFTFNYSPVISNGCKRHNNLPYIALVYDCPQVLLYSYTIINPCNYVFIFDKTLYLELKKEQIPTVYYAPLAVNTKRLKRQLEKGMTSGFATASFAQAISDFSKYTADVSFVGSMYNEKHNFFEMFNNLPPYIKGYLDAIMEAQLKVYGYFFIEDVLTPPIIAELKKSVPLEPNKDGVETIQYLYAHYFIARKLAQMERHDLLSAVSKKFDTKLFTPNPTPELPMLKNMGPIDYYDEMPFVFANSKINLNISLRSIRSGIPLRCLDVMGTGGFLLSNYQADIYDYFIPGEDLAIFESKEDLINKCDYYLKHETERAQIAANGLGKINEYHTFEIRLQELFDLVFG